MDSPKAPDPKETAAAQTSANVNTAIANSYLGNVNQYTPQYNLEYNKTGKEFIQDPNGNVTLKNGKKGYYVPTFSATTTLTEPYQQVEDNNVATQQNLSGMAADQSAFVRDYLNEPFSIKDAPKAGNLNGFDHKFDQRVSMGPERGNLDDMVMTYGDADTAARVKSVEDALFSRMTDRLDRDRSSLETQLANQGIARGSEAYGRAMQQYGQDRNDAYMQAILAASQEDSRLQGIARDQAAFEREGQVLQNADRDTDSDAVWGRELTRTEQINSNQEKQNAAVLQRDAAMDADRQRYIEEEAFLRNQPLNEIIGLMNGSQIQGPQFQNISMPTIPTTDVAGITQQAYQNELEAARQKNSLPLAVIGGGANIASGYFMG